MKLISRIPLIVIFGLLINSQVNGQIVDSLLLKTSFNSNIIVNKDVIWNHHLSGTDSVTGYTFPDDLPGDDVEHFFNYVVNDLDNYVEYANAEIINSIGYDGESTNVLYLQFLQDDSTHDAFSRVQYVIYGDESSNDPVHRLNRGYVKFRMKMHFLKDENGTDWSLPIELKDFDDDGFRVGFYVYDSNGFSPYYVAKGQYMIDGELGNDVWQYDNFDFPVIEDEWFEIEYYWLSHPDSNSGKLKIAINGEIIFDITNQTKDPNQPNKPYYFMPFKIYGNVGESWITDFEFWSDPPVNSFGTTGISVKEQSINESFTIYPNPIENVISLEKTYDNMPFQVISSLGCVVKEGIIKFDEIGVSKLEPGQYSVKIFDREKNTIWTTKIIKK